MHACQEEGFGKIEGKREGAKGKREGANERKSFVKRGAKERME